METTANLALPYIAAGQAQKHVTHNEALLMLDNIVQLCVVDRDQTTAPENPNDGDRHIVGSAASGVWEGKDGQVAVYQGGGWTFYVQGAGWIAWVLAEDRLVAWNGVAWATVAGETLDAVALLGINAFADETNRLSVSSEASLFNHDGEGHQLKINKAAPVDTASLLYQSGFSGRAEMGLTGDDNFHVKVSAEGASWKEAMVISGETARVGIGTDAPQARVHCQVEAGDHGRAFLMTGQGISGSADPDNGAVLVLSHNMEGNRQFVLANSESGSGIRVIGSALDGYNFHTASRQELHLGTESDGVAVLGPLRMDHWARVGSFSKAALPSAWAAGAGAIIYVADDAGGPTLAFSDGSEWRRATDRAVVS